MGQLKTFNVTEKYDEILPFLDSKKNQSGFICELILNEMRGERIQQSMSELNEELLKSSASLIKEEIRIEIRSEFKDFKREFFENFTIQTEDTCNNDF